MIGRLTGRVALKAADHVMLDVGGVGYVVHCSERTLAALPAPGGVVALWTELVVREDLMQLFGFAGLAEREWHRLLVTVQGVSARGALSILGTLGPEGVARAIALGDAGAMRKAPGIGPKLAQRLVNELRDKAAGVIAIGLAEAPPAPEAAAPAGDGGTGAAELPPAPAAAAASADALSALLNLGYARGEAAAAVADAAAGAPGAPAADLIRAALRRLAPKG